MLVTAATTFDALVGGVLIVFSFVFAYGLIPGRTDRTQVGAPRAAALANGFFFLGLGRLLDADALAAVGLVGVIASAYFWSKESRQRRR